MFNIKSLNAEELRVRFDFFPEFELTSEISPYKEIIGQDRAVSAINTGLGINNHGYNVFICGTLGLGDKSNIINRIKEHAEKFQKPNDWCYVNNFAENEKPIALELKTGYATKLKVAMENLITGLLQEVPKCFNTEKYGKLRTGIIDKYQKQILNIVDVLYVECKKNNFIVKNTEDGFTFTPLYEGEEMTEKIYNELEEGEKNKINEVVNILKVIALDVMRKSKIVKRELSNELKNLDGQNAEILVKDRIQTLIKEFGSNKKVYQYFEAVEEDIIENIEAFMDDAEEADEYDEDFLERYAVNVLTSNNEEVGLPVVYENYPEYNNLIGKIEYENKAGNITSDFTAIQGGAFHKSNGGYIIMDAYQLLTSAHAWEATKRALKNKSINIEGSRSSIELVPMITFKPEEIPLQIKVILIGSPFLYYYLYNNDEDFKELFKIKADFEDEIENNKATTLKLLGHISNYCFENNIMPVSRSGVLEILKYSLRLGESKKYFTASTGLIDDLLIEGASIARFNNCEFIDDNHIREIIFEKDKRHGVYRDKVFRMYKEGKYIVETTGYRIGEINGLTIVDYGDIFFGKQIRITVTTYAGKDGIINIEREASMSGNIHSKGIMILGGFMGENFGKELPLSFNASICFEQLYGEVDGDSASAAQLVALLSSLGEIPIKQSIAITGSVNQRGEIQAVGGINEKIEGFFDICSYLGLDGSQGVIIPYSNIEDLVLKEEVIKEIENKKFAIYGVKSIEECLEIICKEDIKKGGRKSTYDIVKKRVEDKLKKYNNAFSVLSKE